MAKKEIKEVAEVAEAAEVKEVKETKKATKKTTKATAEPEVKEEVVEEKKAKKATKKTTNAEPKPEVKEEAPVEKEEAPAVVEEAHKTEVDPVEVSVEQKLVALYTLQQVDSKIDEIRAYRGNLPLEIQDLEDEIAGLETRIANFKEDSKKHQKDISDYKIKIKETEALIKKYEDQQNNVRNNREYDSLTKEIEYQQLDNQLSEKRIREITAKDNEVATKVAEAQMRLTESLHSTRRKRNYSRWWKAPRRKRNNSCNVRPTVRSWWKTVCLWLISASVRMPVTVLPLSVSSMKLVVAASTVSRHNTSWTSARTRKSSCASIAAVSLLTRASSHNTTHKLCESKTKGCSIRAAFFRLEAHLERGCHKVFDLFLCDGFDAQISCIV